VVQQFLKISGDAFMAYGQLGHLGLCFQGSVGTPLTNSLSFVPIVSETVAETIEPLVETGMYGRLAEPPRLEGVHKVEGEVRTEAHPVHIGSFLKAALGKVTTSLQGSAFVHEFLPAAADWDNRAAVPPVTMEVHRDVGSAFVYSDMLATSLALEIAQGQLLSAKTAWVGGRLTRQAAAAPSFKSGRPYTWDVASASYDGVAIADLRKVSLVFDNQLAAQYTLSSGRSPRRVVREGPQTVSIEGTLVLQDQVLFQEFLDQSEKRLVLAFDGPQVASGTNARLTLDVPRLRFTEFAPQLAGPGQVEVGFAAKGVYDTTSGYALRVTLVNTQAAY
jgi:hypothetical protein